MVCEMLPTTKRYTRVCMTLLEIIQLLMMIKIFFFILIVYTFCNNNYDLRQEIDNKSKEWKKSVLLLCKIILTYFFVSCIYAALGVFSVIIHHEMKYIFNPLL